MIDALTDRARSDADELRLEVGVQRWTIGTGRWEAACSYDFEIHSSSSPSRPSVGHVTDVLKVVDGNWQIVYRHESTS